MKCECGSDTRTTDTRKVEAGVWRRRVCKTCGTVFTTIEQVCVTLASPYRSSKTGEFVPGVAMVPPVPKSVPRPKDTRKARVKHKHDFTPADFAPKPKPTHWNAGRAPAAPPVDYVSQTARDRIEDMKAERGMVRNGYGWEK